MSDNIKEFNKALKEKLEDTFGKEFVNDKIVIMGLNDDKEQMMSNIHNEQTLEQIHEQVLEDDAKGLIDDDIDEICYLYNLHADDDRDEILTFISENIFYNKEKI